MKLRQDVDDRKYCDAAFPDITQSFYKGWHTPAQAKNRLLFPYFLILESYVIDSYFLPFENSHKIESTVSESSVLGFLLHVLYMADLSKSSRPEAATDADFTQ